jgi:hypothetical protein
MMKNGAKKHSEKQVGAPELNELLERLDGASKRINTLAEEATRRIQALEARWWTRNRASRSGARRSSPSRPPFVVMTPAPPRRPSAS